MRIRWNDNVGTSTVGNLLINNLKSLIDEKQYKCSSICDGFLDLIANKYSALDVMILGQFEDATQCVVIWNKILTNKLNNNNAYFSTFDTNGLRDLPDVNSGTNKTKSMKEDSPLISGEDYTISSPSEKGKSEIAYDSKRIDDTIMRLREVAKEELHKTLDYIVQSCVDEYNTFY